MKPSDSAPDSPIEPVLAVDQSFFHRGRTPEGASILWSPERGREVTLSASLVSLLERFAIPKSRPAALSELVGSDQHLGARLGSAVDHLLAEGLLVEYESAASSTRDAGSSGLFGAPLVDVARFLIDPVPRVGVIGVEYDAGASGPGGSRFAPDDLRRVSTSLFRSRHGDGMYDVTTDTVLLEDVILADLGNLGAGIQLRNGQVLDELAEVVSALRGADRLPVVLGGDHSITHAVVRGLIAGGSRRLGLLHFDAHSDYLRPATGDWRASLHHGNVMSWVAGHEEVLSIVQFGVRQLIDETPEPHSKIVSWPGRTCLAACSGDIVDRLPPDLDWHVTIDVDVLDPAVCSATGTPLPGGLTVSELNDLLGGILPNIRVVGIDVVELIGRKDEPSTLAAADVLLRAVHAATATATGTTG